MEMWMLIMAMGILATCEMFYILINYYRIIVKIFLLMIFVQFVNGDGTALISHFIEWSGCPYNMTVPAHLSIADHLSEVFGSYPIYDTDWNFDNTLLRLWDFQVWFLNKPCLFIISLFMLTFVFSVYLRIVWNLLLFCILIRHIIMILYYTFKN